ncbi:hypothetical protein N665_0331s0011 [Sinapis alba]|nr:hypothetical protein N665_0331s0011 [Sinapis alba]
MKKAFQPSLIGFIMLTILLFGVMTIAQKGGPIPKPKKCYDMFKNASGKCEITQCKAECASKKKGKDAHCRAKVNDCVCIYAC